MRDRRARWPAWDPKGRTGCAHQTVAIIGLSGTRAELPYTGGRGPLTGTFHVEPAGRARTQRPASVPAPPPSLARVRRGTRLPSGGESVRCRGHLSAAKGVPAQLFHVEQARGLGRVVPAPLRGRPGAAVARRFAVQRAGTRSSPSPRSVGTRARGPRDNCLAQSGCAAPIAAEVAPPESSLGEA